ncbi:MAG: hypothetical protein OEY64_07620 [Nitrospinota bacterium]|nr:hypothetical protein [Nitrospinota bacterium]
MLKESDRHYPELLHYSPNFKATLWTLILLADLCHDSNDVRIKKPLKIIRNHFYDPKAGIYSLKEDHFPIPCLNGNIIYLECYFTGSISGRSLKVIEFFNKYQRFDDGQYVTEKNKYCENKSCYGKHTCYWGVVKLFKGFSFIPQTKRNSSIKMLLKKCIDFILLHNVYLSSRRKDRVMVKDIDKLTFPNMYRSDFLEILWLLKREKVRSEKVGQAVDLLRSKRMPDGRWNLEKKINNMAASIGEPGRPNEFVTRRGKEVIEFYGL